MEFFIVAPFFGFLIGEKQFLPFFSSTYYINNSAYYNISIFEFVKGWNTLTNVIYVS